MSFGSFVPSGLGNLIEGNLPNLVYYGSFTATRVHGPVFSTTTSETTPLYTHKGFIPGTSSSEVPIVMFKPQNQNLFSSGNLIDNLLFNYGIGIETLQHNGTGWDVYFTCGTLVGSFTFEAYVNIKDVNLENNTWGMQAYSSTGNLIFDSAQTPVNWLGYSLSNLQGSWIRSGNLNTNSAQYSEEGVNRCNVSVGCRAGFTPGGIGDVFVYDNLIQAPLVIRADNALIRVWCFIGSTGFPSFTAAANTYKSNGISLYYTPTADNRVINYFNHQD